MALTVESESEKSQTADGARPISVSGSKIEDMKIALVPSEVQGSLLQAEIDEAHRATETVCGECISLQAEPSSMKTELYA